MKRLFFAIRPPPAAAKALADWADEVHALGGGRKTPVDSIHLTLAFLGQAEPQRAVAAARRVNGTSHRLPIEQARYVNHMVWVGPHEMPAALAALQARLAMELFREEFILERRPFAAHVTLIRKARGSVLPALPAIDWPVNEFVLMSSSLSPRGPTYTRLEHFSLT